MTYRDNVTALANSMGISNDPGLREEDLGIGGLHFYDSRGGRTRILGTRMNRASRLFFEHYTISSTDIHRDVISGLRILEIKATAGTFFAELWADNTTPRTLLDAFKTAESVVLYWKSNSNWFLNFARGHQLERPTKKERELTDDDRAVIFELLAKHYGCEEHDQIRNALAAFLGLTTSQVGILAERQWRTRVII
jgi:hypothetical protein